MPVFEPPKVIPTTIAEWNRYFRSLKAVTEDNTVSEDKLTTGAVTTNKISTGAVTTPKIADDAVTPDKLSEAYYTETESDARFQPIFDVQSVSTATNAVINTVYLVTGNTTITLPTATQGEIIIKNNGTGIVTIAGTLDGSTNNNLKAGDCANIYCDGTGFYLT